MTRSVQQEFDDLAQANSWQVDARDGESVYTRGGETLTLQFSGQGAALAGAERTTPFDVSARDCRGQIGNVLRRRYRSYETEEAAR